MATYTYLHTHTHSLTHTHAQIEKNKIEATPDVIILNCQYRPTTFGAAGMLDSRFIYTKNRSLLTYNRKIVLF